MTSGVEGVIFDWAGTTVDFGCFAPVETFVESFQKYGIAVSINEARKPMGLSKIEHIRAMLKMPRIKNLWELKFAREPNEQDIQRLYRTFETALLTLLPHYTEPIPEVVETVKKLRDAGIKIGSTTGYTKKMMEIVIAGAYKKGYAVDACYTAEDTSNLGRPYPYMIFQNMEALQITATKKVIKVGDTIQDIKEAQNAGIWAVAVIIGSSELGLSSEEFYSLSIQEQANKIQETKQTFLKNGADFTIETMSGLFEIIQKINDRLKNI